MFSFLLNEKTEYGISEGQRRSCWQLESLAMLYEDWLDADAGVRAQEVQQPSHVSISMHQRKMGFVLLELYNH